MIAAVMSSDLRGVFLLVAVVLFVIAAVAAYGASKLWPVLVALGLAFATFPAMWDAFAV